MDKFRLYYDKEKSLDLMQRIEKKFGETSRKTARGSEMHVYDLTNCPVKAYCRLLGMEAKITKISIGLMVFGIVSENVLGWTFPNDELQYQTSISLIDPDESIFGHIDIYEDKVYPLEVKGTRKNIFKGSDIPIPWVEQTMSYMAMQGATMGWIILFNVFSAQIMAFRLVMTSNDILDWLITLSVRSSTIKKAVKERSPTALEIHPEEYENCNYKLSCPRSQECHKKSNEIKLARKAKKTKS